MRRYLVTLFWSVACMGAANLTWRFGQRLIPIMLAATAGGLLAGLFRPAEPSAKGGQRKQR